PEQLRRSSSSKFPPRPKFTLPQSDEDSDFIPAPKKRSSKRAGGSQLYQVPSSLPSNSSVASSSSSFKSQPHLQSNKRKRVEDHPPSSIPIDQETFFRVLKKHKEEVVKSTQSALEKLEEENKLLKKHLLEQTGKVEKLERQMGNVLYSIDLLQRSEDPLPLSLPLSESTAVHEPASPVYSDNIL
ncbi:hypothetical protein AYI68_g7240, partial [Smittium mucronatum]